MSEAPPPLKSPTVPGVGVAQADPSSENTGVWPATRTFTRWIGWLSTLRTLGLILVGVVAGTVLGWEKLAGMARAEGRAEARAVIASLEPRVTAAEQTRVEVYDMRKELREYVKWQARNDGKPLDLPPLPPPPPTPGGPKDAGP